MAFSAERGRMPSQKRKGIQCREKPDTILLELKAVSNCMVRSHALMRKLSFKKIISLA